MVVFIFLGVGAYLFSNWFEKKVQETIFEELGRLKSRFGLVVTVDSVEVGFGKVQLNKLGVGQEPWLAIDRLDIAISLNPFSDFLRPSSVNINRAILKISEQKKDWPPELKKIIERAIGRDDRKVKVSKRKNLWFLPQRISLRLERIDWTDSNRSLIAAEQLAITAQLIEKRMAIRSTNMIVWDRVKQGFIESEISLDSDREYRVNVRERPNFKGRPLWSSSCQIERDFVSLNCDIDADRLPEVLTDLFKPKLGGVFSPGFRGNIGVESLDQNTFQKFRLNINGVWENITVEHEALSVVAVGPVNLRAKMEIDLDVSQRSLSAGRSDLFVFAPGAQGGVGIPVSTEFALSFGDDIRSNWLPSGNLQLDVDAVDCGAAIRTIPQSFLPELTGFELGGSGALHAQIRLDEAGAQFSLAGSRFDCSVIKSPETYSAGYLQGPFVIERETPDGKITIPVDPARPYYISYNAVPNLVRSAFVSSEDTGFFSHRGVELGAIVGAVQRNAEAKRPAVGGSTITMQTVKNLFLARDKTLSRKLQEMFLAWHLEKTISKERILEIYLNMVEFGPGLFGIGRASQKFFSKDPADLSLKEAIYLASLLPAPIPRYRYFCKGEVTENYKKIINQLLARMLALGRITQAQFAAAMSEKLEFSKIERESACAGTNTDGSSPTDTIGED